VSRILTIAGMAFTETVRDKILYSILVFALAMIGSSTILVTLSVGGEGRIMKDLGLSCITLFGLFIAVFIGINLVSREIERRTIFSLLSKPVRRAEFLVGKFLGLGLTLAVNVGVMAAGLMVLAWALEDHWSPRILLAVGFSLLELSIVTATAILFSTFSTPTLSAVYTLLVFVIGRLTADLMDFASQFGGKSLKATVLCLYYVLPNLARFNLISAVVDDLSLDSWRLSLTAVYGVLYAAAVLGLAIAVFQRRDFR
jgi:ABC-type transport system involved in multi-copper enzyme maturation permease subunit